MNLLNQIRRTNEGDDTADSPGYSLNLVRIPVSILPGKKTRAGYGAEVTFTLSPILGEELLPSTYRTLVLNDLSDQLGFPLVRVLEDPETVRYLTAENRSRIVANPDAPLMVGLQSEPTYYAAPEFAPGTTPPGRPFQTLPNIGTPSATPGPAKTRKVAPTPMTQAVPRPTVLQTAQTTPLPPTQMPALAPSGAGSVQVRQAFKSRFTIPTLAPAKGLIGRTAFPNSEILDIYGPEFCFEIAYQANQSFEGTIAKNGYAHLPDIQSFLQAESSAAYRFLATPSNLPLWSTFCTPELVAAVRNHDYVTLARMRTDFRTHFASVSSSVPSLAPLHPQSLSITAALAWCILVDSALLTDRLLLDMKETAAAKGCGCFCQGAGDHGGWLDFYHPAPSPEARSAFTAYVKCRWPIRVFALDPENQDQNLIDQLSTRRETQLALSLAFVSGKINASSLTRYARKLDADYQTIAVNRTQVGFSHGEDTFGWRFQPRFQTPDTEPNLTVLVRDQFIGGPNRDTLLHQRRLEPGPRECVAVVLMPSFVPCLTCDSISNWFSLSSCPNCRKFDHTEAMRASRAVKMLQTAGPKVGDADCFRNGDHQRLLRRIDQLEARLPTQTATVPVPVINTLGGFKMFNNGTTDLAPELYGFYGAPGARTDSSVTLFLVGDHFSPLRSRVIVGNQLCETKMLSRQVVMVTVPPMGVPTSDRFLNAHLATPYGVSREIEIPVVAPYTDPKWQLKLDTTTWVFGYGIEAITPIAKTPLYQFKYLNASPNSSVLTWIGSAGAAPEVVQVTVNVVLNDVPLTLTQLVPKVNNTYTVRFDRLGQDLVNAVNGNDKLKPAGDPNTKNWPSGTITVSSFKVAPAAEGSKEITVLIGADRAAPTLVGVRAAYQEQAKIPVLTPPTPE